MFNIFALLLVGVLFLIDKKRTIKGIKIGIKKIKKNIPIFLNMIILVSITLYFISDEFILRYLDSGNYISNLLIASSIGSVAFMPGFVVFPLSGMLLEKGVSYGVLAAFTTTMMMVGITTFQIEKDYFGTKLALFRNFLGLVMAIIVSIVIGLSYGGAF